MWALICAGLRPSNDPAAGQEGGASRNYDRAARALLEDLPEVDGRLLSVDRVAERYSRLTTAFNLGMA